MGEALGGGAIEVPTPDQLQQLQQWTGRRSIQDALSWIAEGRPTRAPSTSVLLEVLVAACASKISSAEEALRVVSRVALQSDLDTSAELVAPETILDAGECDRALKSLASHSANGLIGGASVGAFLATLPDHPRVVEIYSQIAGLSWRDLRDRAASRDITLPKEASAPWSAAQLSAVIALVNDVVVRRPRARLKGAVGAQPIELLTAPVGLAGWDAVERFQEGGVTYGQLLAQRIAGGSWGAHRNRTASAVGNLLVEEITGLFELQGVQYWTAVGQPGKRVSKKFLSEAASKSGAPLGQLAIVTRTVDGRASLAIFVAIAHDGGTARKTAATLTALPAQLKIDGAVVLGGRGWALRGESDDLVRAFSGRAFGDRRLDELVALATAHANNRTE